MPPKGKPKPKPRDKKKEEEERLAREQKEAEEAAAAEEEARQLKKANQHKPKSDPMDILTQKGYYDEMIHSRAAMQEKMKVLDDEVLAEEREKAEIEKMISAMHEWLEKHQTELEEKQKEMAKLDRNLAELDDPNLSDSARARKLKFAGMAGNPLERAAVMREEFRAKYFQAYPPLEFGLSSTPRGGGPEAVETQDLECVDSGVALAVRCYSPAGKPFNEVPPPPAIVFFHGGGYVLGDLETHDWLCRSLSALSGSTVVSVDYRRAPEHKYPAAFEDAYAALQWVARGGLGQTPRRLGVAGDCAGGGLAAACCLRARDDPEGPQICVQLLAYPWLDLRASAPSMKHAFADGRHGLSSDECHWFREAYAPEGAGPDGEGPWSEETSASPAMAASLAGLPRAFIVYPVQSMLSGESIDFVERFRAEVGPEAVHVMRVDGPEHHFAVRAHEPQTQQVVFAAATYASALLWAP